MSHNYHACVASKSGLLREEKAGLFRAITSWSSGGRSLQE